MARFLHKDFSKNRDIAEAGLTRCSAKPPRLYRLSHDGEGDNFTFKFHDIFDTSYLRNSHASYFIEYY